MKALHLRGVLLVGSLYLVAGILLGWLAGQAGSVPARNAWRWAAWAISAVAFGIHIAYEQIRLRSPHRITALNVAAAAAVGAFGLAVAANIHAMSVSTRPYPVALGLSLAIWPIMTAIPAFLVALLAATLFARARQSR